MKGSNVRRCLSTRHWPSTPRSLAPASARRAAGRMDEAVFELARAAELDPLSPIILDNYGMVLIFAGRPADALPVIERARVLLPDSQQTLAWKVWALTDVGRVVEAIAVAHSI